MTTLINEPGLYSLILTRRTVLRSGVVWFFLTDVCAVLEIVNVSHAASRLDDDEKTPLANDEGSNFNELGTIGAMPTLINESGLYSLILTSRKPQAKAFKKWLTSVVLPALRQDGAYVVGEENMDEDTLILRAHEALQRKVDRLRRGGVTNQPLLKRPPIRKRHRERIIFRNENAN